MSNIKACLSNKSDEWCTPSTIYKRFIDQGFYDPCPINHIVDGLIIDWKCKTFVNPPYSKISLWVEKAISEREKNVYPIVMLLPARPDTQWFKKLVMCPFVKIRFIEGRLRFNDYKSAPFPSMFVEFGKEFVPRFNRFDYLSKNLLEVIYYERF